MANMLFGEQTVVEDSQIAKYTGLMGALLSGVVIKRKDSSGVVSMVNVPIMYAAANARNRQANPTEVNHGTNLPAMSFELKDITLDSTRVTANMPIYGRVDSKQPYKREGTWMPRPYDFGYTLTIRANTISEAFLVFETIAPQFDPVLAFKVTDQREVGIERDVSVYLEGSPQIHDNYEESFVSNRYVDITLNFTLKGFIYKPAIGRPVVLETAFNMGEWDTAANPATTKQKAEYLAEHQNETLDTRLSNSQKELENVKGRPSRRPRAAKPPRGK